MSTCSRVSYAVLVITLASPALIALHSQRDPQARLREGVLAVFAALIGEDLEVKPVPLLELELTIPGDSGIVRSFRTGLDGKAEQTVPPGRYLLRTPTPTRFRGLSYRWNLDVRVVAGQRESMELTNANAQVDSSVAVTERQIAPEIALYERIRRAVVQVRADLGHGTGFFVDTLGGVIVTNDHVVGGRRDVSVVLDSSTRVPAHIIIRNHDADLALLRIHPGVCPDCPRLRLATPDSSGRLVHPGERVIAVGFPLSQQSTVTSGIVSGVRERHLVSDVSINPGNSGGPLLRMDGSVVGVNTFVEQGGSGPGISGALAISHLRPLLTDAADSIEGRAPPDDVRLPLPPQGSGLPAAQLWSLADALEPDIYKRHYVGKNLGNFTLNVTTPVANFVLARAEEREVTKDRRKREARANLGEGERYSDFAGFRDWMDYVGGLTTPVVTLEVAPRQGETFGSALGRAFVAGAAGVATQAKYVFKGDLEHLAVYRDGELVRPLLGGRTPQRVYYEDQWVQMKDVAYRGYYVLDPEVFAPDSTGAPPVIVLEISDLKHPNDRKLFRLDPKLVAQIWNDFAVYYEARGVTFVRSDARLSQ